MTGLQITGALFLRSIGAAFLTALLFPAASAQMLARPGWTGSSTTAPASWKHAVLYQIDTRTFSDSDGDGVGDLKGIAQHLDYLHALGVEAIVIDSLAPSTAPAGQSLTAPMDPSLGTIDDFDALALDASRHNIRILLELAQPDPALARFWLTRGVAGFRINGAADPVSMQAIRKLMTAYPGRILITEAGSPNPPSGTRQPASELMLDTFLLEPAAAGGGAADAAQLRGALEHLQALPRGSTPILATDGNQLPREVNRLRTGGNDAEIAKTVGTVLLLSRSAALIYAGQELGLPSPGGKPVMMPWGPPPVAAVPSPPPKPVPMSTPDVYVPYVPPPPPPKQIPPDPASAAGQDLNPNSVLNFYRHLIVLHHGNTALRDGDQVAFNHDGERALVWVRKPPSPSYQNAPIVVLCNLSDKPLEVSLKDDLALLHLRGSFLRKLLRSDGEMGSMLVDPISLPPFGVYVGELKY